MILELPDTLLEALAQRVAAMTEQAPARQWFNAEQAGEYLGTTRDGITALVKCGQLEPTRRKPHYLFSRATLDREREAAEAAGLVGVDVDEGKIIRALKAKAENGDVPAARELREWWEVQRRTDNVRHDKRMLELLSPTTRKLIEVDLRADGLPEDLVELIECALRTT